MAVYPWQSATLARISGQRARLPHALLLHGNSGTGKLDFAHRLAESLLCLAPHADGEPCDSCASCNWFVQGNHPDFRLLAPEQDNDADADAGSSKKTTRKSQQISVDQVRELADFLTLSSHQSSGLRVVLIHPAEALNPTSANALLKMLEEPPGGVIFILVSHQLKRLLPTILSRCHKIDMPMPEKTVALNWLQGQGIADAAARLDYAGGAPLNVLRMQEQGAGAAAGLLLQGRKLDPFLAATAAVAAGMELAIDDLQKWTFDLLSCLLTGKVRYYNQHIDALQALVKSVDLSLLLEFQRKLNEAKKSAQHPLNNELQLEAIFLDYTQLFMKKS
ncbi:MAG: DNA polymerase III subunit delta' [Methylophilaceae bacterium]|jgi:DNA polymerase-3 subunit delta'|nr:DNA polymerase III subunit delta' [Methylophilaceae bacterium]